MRGRPPIPTHLHLVRGTFRKSRHGRRPDALAPPAEGELTRQQRQLLGAIPRHLTAQERAIYVEQAMLGWWLTAADASALAAFSEACERHHVASAELQRLMKLPLDGKTPAEAKAMIAWMSVADHAADRVLSIADRLGFTPGARQRLGVNANARPEPKDDKNDPWNALKLVSRPEPPD